MLVTVEANNLIYSKQMSIVNIIKKSWL